MPNRANQYWGIHPIQSLMELPIPEYKVLIDGILYAGEHVMLIGSEGIGKSILALEMAMCLSSGDTFLDSFSVPAALPVLYVQTEGAPRMNVDRIPAMVGGVRMINSNMNLAWFPSLFLDRPEDLDKFVKEYKAKFAGEIHPRCIVIDSLYSSMSGDLSDNVAARNMCSALKTLSEVAHGAALFIIHHEHKTRRDYRGEVIHEEGREALMGSTMWNNHVDSGLRLERTSSTRFILSQWKDRNGHAQLMKPLELQLSQTPLMFSVADSSTPSDRTVENIITVDYTTNGLTGDQYQGIAEVELIGRCRLSRSSVLKSLRVLTDQGIIERANPGKYPVRWKVKGR